jgi:hypothetical protein
MKTFENKYESSFQKNAQALTSIQILKDNYYQSNPMYLTPCSIALLRHRKNPHREVPSPRQSEDGRAKLGCSLTLVSDLHHPTLVYAFFL